MVLWRFGILAEDVSSTIVFNLLLTEKKDVIEKWNKSRNGTFVHVENGKSVWRGGDKVKTVLRTTLASNGCFSNELGYSCGTKKTMMSTGFSRGRAMGFRHARRTLTGLIRSCMWEKSRGYSEWVV